jgi:hypothetical protein
MKGARIADVHGNLIALQAVLDELEQEGINCSPPSETWRKSAPSRVCRHRSAAHAL